MNFVEQEPDSDLRLKGCYLSLFKGSLSKEIC